MRRQVIAPIAVTVVMLAMSACDGASTPSSDASATSTGSHAQPSSSPSDHASPDGHPTADSTTPADDIDGKPSDEPTSTSTTAVLVSASVSEDDGVVSLAGYVDGVIADGGTCRYTLTRASVSVTADVTGVADASTTQCPWADVTTSSLGSGEWKATVTYLPTGAVSDAVSVTIP